jgi:hypothetical protein
MTQMQLTKLRQKFVTSLSEGGIGIVRASCPGISLLTKIIEVRKGETEFNKYHRVKRLRRLNRRE